MNKKILVVVLAIALVTGLALSGTSFAASKDKINVNQTSGWYTFYNYKSTSSNIEIKYYNADNSTVDGVLYKKNKKYYTFKVKKKNLGIKTIIMKYQYYDKDSDSYINVTKKYKGKNKKSLTIKLPRYEQLVYSGISTTIYSMGRPVYTIRRSNTYSYPYSVLDFTIKYSNNKKVASKKFSNATSNYQQRTFTGKKTSITRNYKVSITTGNIAGKISYTIQAKKKTAKIKKISLKFYKYDSKYNKIYKTVTVKGKNKNSVVKKVANKYYFESAVVYYK